MNEIRKEDRVVEEDNKIEPGYNNNNKDSATNLTVEAIREVVEETIKQNPLVFNRLAEL